MVDRQILDQLLGTAGGTVTSVALTVPSRQTVTGSPVTGAGTLGITDNNQNANLVFAGPSSGGPAAPLFRALVAADIPSLSATYLPLAGGTMTGPILGAVGSVSAPGYAFAGHADTGFSWGTSRISVSIGGVESFRFGLNSNGTPRLSLGSLIDDTLSVQSAFLIANSGSSNSSNLTVVGETNVNLAFQRFSNDATAPLLSAAKGRGTVASPAVPSLNDNLGQLLFRGQNTAGSISVTTSSAIAGTLIETGTVSATAMGGRLLFSACPIGSGTLSEIMRLDVATGLSMFGANPVIGPQRGHVFRAFAVASLPTGVNPYTEFYITDATTAYPLGAGTAPTGGGANKRKVYTVDGTNWLMF